MQGTKTSFIRSSYCRLAVIATVCCLTFTSLPAQGPGCTPEQVTRAVSRSACLDSDDLRQVIAYQELLAISKTPPDETSLREALIAAQRVTACINDYRSFPSEPEATRDFHCVQQKVLDFYAQVRQPEVEREPQFQDLLAHASTRIHYCMLAPSSSLNRCLILINQALQDTVKVYSETATRLAAMDSDTRAQVLKDDEAIPTPASLRDFVELSLENARRFPRLVGKQFGAGLSPILCNGLNIHPEMKPEIVDLYNLLIRFDFGNLAGGTALFDFVTRLRETFQPASLDFSFLQLNPTDWNPSPAPCADEDWLLEFPAFELLPGYRLPKIGPLRLQLEDLEKRLLKAADLAERRNYIWKPFIRYGNFLLGLANSLRRASSRDPLLWETRHLLMEKARDAILMRSVAENKHPLDPTPIRDAVTQQIEGYGKELLVNLQLERLIDFAQQYLQVGEVLLSTGNEKQLHRLLAIAHSIQGDNERASTHLQESDLQPGDLEDSLRALRRMGVGIRVQRAP